jgi:SAM-dependent methyltransferase
MITARETQTYTDLFALDAYAAHSPGEQYVPLFLDMAQPRRDHVILDAGCGSGKGAVALKAHGFVDVRCCDLTAAGLVDAAKDLAFYEACLWKDLRAQLPYLFGRQVDWVYCCDVLEHIPPTFTMLVISRLLEIARKGVFLSIALQPDVFGVWVGKPLHQTVQSFTDWRDQISELGTVTDARDLLTTGMYLVTT